MAFRLRRGTDAERLIITPEEGELIYTTDTKQIFVGDGITLGGNVVNTEIDLDDVGGVDLTTNPPNTGQSLQYDGTNWVPGDITGILEGSTFRIDIVGNILGDDSSVLIDHQTSLLTMDTVSANSITGATISGNLIGDGSGITDMVTTNLEDWSKSVPDAGDALVWNAVDSVWQPTTTLDISGNLSGTFTGEINATGTFTGDIQGSVFGADSAEVINRFGDVVGKISTLRRMDVSQTDDTDQVLLRGTGLAKPGAIGPQLLFQTSTGTVDAPLTVEGGTTGDALGEIQGSGYDGSDYNIAGIVRIATDLDSTVAPGVVPGRVMFITANSAGNLQNLLLFNSQGYLGLGTPRPDEKLHVNNGNAKIDGFVQFGSLTTAERDALTAANGMVIYNTTDNKFQGYENGAWVNLI